MSAPEVMWLLRRDSDVLRVKPDHWPEHLAVTDALLELAVDGISSGDGFIRFEEKRSSALYGMAHADPDIPGANHYDLLRVGRWA